MDEADLMHVAQVAAGLDRLVPKIAEAMRMVEHEDEYRRLADLLRPAEEFLLEAGRLMSRAKPDTGSAREIRDRFVRELPRRLRMLRMAQAIRPPLFEQSISLARAG